METEQTQGPSGHPEHAGSAAEHAHPGARTYVNVAIVLAFMTAIEVAIYYLNMPHGLLIGLLFFFMINKFALVALYFMHLKFDSRIFTRLMMTGIILAVTVYVIVLLTFGILR